MKQTLLNALVLFGMCVVTHAQEPAPSKMDQYFDAGMEVAGVRVPYYDEDGKLQAQLYGGGAKVLAGGKADVTNLRLDVYQDGAVAMTLFAPQCFTETVEEGGRSILVVYSDGDVLIEMEQMSICGKGFRFSSDTSRFEILDDAKVIVKESAKNMEGLTL